MTEIRLLTIGFTKKTAERFFTTLSSAGAERLLDVRLNNVSQLAGFAKREDLKYFLKAICKTDYIHLPELAPNQAILDAFKKQKGMEWSEYADQYLQLLRTRRVEETLDRALFQNGCLLCSEDTPHHCHRRLAAEYLRQHWGNLQIVHL
jgi:uncharacterized protein (DUF488 family)